MVVLTYLYVYLKTSIKNRYLFKQQQDETSSSENEKDVEARPGFWKAYIFT